MTEFWVAQEQIAPGRGFPLFGPLHLLWLLLIAAGILLGCVAYRRAGADLRRRIRRGLALACLLIEASQDAALIVTGQFRLNYLPLDLCGLAIFALCWDAARPTSLVRELIWCLFGPGALLALLFPNWSPMPAANFIFLHGFLLHALLIAYPLLLRTSGEFRANLRNLPKCFAIAVALCIPIYCIDRVWNQNFFFLAAPSPDSPLSLFAQWLGDPGYLLCFPAMAVLLWAALYLPGVLLRRYRAGRAGG